MNDDWSMFIAVTAVMLMMIYISLYIQNLARIKSEWENLKCNPLYMFVNSLSASDKSSLDNFKKCVANV
jgi:hypothetical protein